jgi:hypothetical protein
MIFVSYIYNYIYVRSPYNVRRDFHLVVINLN